MVVILCSLPNAKHIYDSENADKMYEIHLSKPRVEILIGSDSLKELISLTKLCRAVVHLQFLATEKKHNSVSPSTIYRWAKNDTFPSKPMIASLKTKPARITHILSLNLNTSLLNAHNAYLDRNAINELFETVPMILY